MKRLPYRIAFAAIVGALAAACASAPDQTAEAKACTSGFADQTGRIVDGKCVVSYQSNRNALREYGPQRGSTFSPPSFPAETRSE